MKNILPFPAVCSDPECINSVNEKLTACCAKCGKCGNDAHSHQACDAPDTVHGRKDGDP
jgi:hypothetical protein